MLALWWGEAMLRPERGRSARRAVAKPRRLAAAEAVAEPRIFRPRNRFLGHDAPWLLWAPGPAIILGFVALLLLRFYVAIKLYRSGK
jgi:hypothetical protein